MRKKPILCVDFDGVIHSYTSPWVDEVTIPDPPVPGALLWLWKATEWFEVVIYSSRSKTTPGVLAMMKWMMFHSREEFGENHPMSLSRNSGEPKEYPIVFAHEKPAGLLDDRRSRHHVRGGLGFRSGQTPCLQTLEQEKLEMTEPYAKRADSATNFDPERQFDADREKEIPMSEDDRLKAWCRANWNKIPELTRKDCIAHLKSKVPEEVLERWKKQGYEEDMMFHFGAGMQVRNILRQRLTDDELPEVIRDRDGKPYGSHNWDDYYTGALDELLERM